MPTADVPRVASAMWRGDRAHPHVGRPLGLLTGAGLPARGRLDLLRLNAGLALGWQPDHSAAAPFISLLATGTRRIGGPTG